MAANSRSAGAIASLGKRITNQIWTSDPLLCSSPISPSASASKLRRAAHSSAYDKNPDEPTRPIVGFDVNVTQPDKYWAPHPQTGVFGPANEHTNTNGVLNTTKADGVEYSVEEEGKAWFRPTSLEDSEKPHGY